MRSLVYVAFGLACVGTLSLVILSGGQAPIPLLFIPILAVLPVVMFAMRGHPWTGVVALFTAVALTIGCVLGLASIGVFFVPCAVVMWVATLVGFVESRSSRSAMQAPD